MLRQKNTKFEIMAIDMEWGKFMENITVDRKIVPQI
jgi:hypothetical protein